METSRRRRRGRDVKSSVGAGLRYIVTPSSNALRRGGLWIAFVALFGLSLAGVANESENVKLHVLGGTIYYVPVAAR